jgi:hypothetical protein
MTHPSSRPSRITSDAPEHNTDSCHRLRRYPSYVASPGRLMVHNRTQHVSTGYRKDANNARLTDHHMRLTAVPYSVRCRILRYSIQYHCLLLITRNSLPTSEALRDRVRLPPRPHFTRDTQTFILGQRYSATMLESP